MPLLIGIIVFLLLAAVGEEQAGLLLGMLAGLAAHYFTTRTALKAIRSELLAVRRQLLEIQTNGLKQPVAKTAQAPVTDARKAADQAPAESQTESQAVARQGQSARGISAEPAIDRVPVVDPWKPATPAQPREDTAPDFAPPQPSLLDKAWNALWSTVKSYFTDGNLFVRIGILILFAGVSFLLKYAAEHSNVPIEFRISLVALGGLGLLFFGWRMRRSKGIYALLVQGAGIGVMYMSIFAAYKIYELIPSLATFVLLAGLAAFSALLAVVQNSKSLAAFGITGGFVAPILASSGSGDYVALFSYFILLNVGVLAIAWFKAWRIINLLGFGFTYLIYTVWVVGSYQNEYVVSADAFLIAFFLMFSLASVLFALRQPLQLKGYVDGTLVFGNPLVAWGLQMTLMRDIEYGIAASAFVFGLYHVGLARFLWNRHNAGVKLFTEALLSIGVIFLTLAIPYSMDGHWTSATWALEGAGILWVSLRQRRKLAQYFAVLLQLASAVVFMLQYQSDASLLPVLNAYYLGGVFIAASGFFSAWQLCKYKLSTPRETLPRLHPIAFGWALLWWVSVNLSQVDLYIHAARDKAHAVLLFTMTTSMLAWWLAKRLGWKLSEITSVASIAVFILIGLHAIVELSPAFDIVGTLLWSLALGYAFWLLHKVEVLEPYSAFIAQFHTAVIVFTIALLSAEAIWLLDESLPYAGEGWRAAYWCMVPVAALFYLLRAGHWPLAMFDARVKKYVAIIVLAALVFWSFAVNLSNSGNPEPLPYLPVLNPVDIMHVFILLLAVRVYQLLKTAIEQRESVALIKVWAIRASAVLIFIWINMMLLRSIHHFAGIGFHPHTLANSALVQVSLSILWTIMGMLAMLYAARKSVRKLWIAGAILVGIVLLKLVTVDLSSHDTVERIVSFIAVGLLLVGMGYFSPIPEKNTQDIT